MTRKCVLCKETNYRNTYSFFSAPKDPETRKKWQNAIAIENYVVTDDTYVCSKHFHKDDIITHWVSGVPPHVITIKYKKCRLRPGAVPGKSYHLQENAQTQENSSDFDNNISKFDKISTVIKKETNFLIPRTEEKSQLNNDENHKATYLNYQSYRNVNDYVHNSKKNFSNKMELSENVSNVNGSTFKESPKHNLNQVKQNKSMIFMENSINRQEGGIDIKEERMEDINSEDKIEEQSQISKEDSCPSISKKVSLASFQSSFKDYISEEHETMIRKAMKKRKLVDDNFEATKNVYIENQIMYNLNYDQSNKYYPMCNENDENDENDENEMLFEDLLEVCTEVLLPRGWSCLVTSKGHTTTIVYLCMGMTKSGMPFTEKQVFIKSDMMLHCAVVNKEINPLIYNLIRTGKHLQVQNLLDIEELIDEFDRRTICQGIYNTEKFQNINRVIVAYKDGIKWRHILCPLIVHTDSLRCTKCIFLSYTLQHKSKKLVFLRNPSIFTKQQQMYSVRQKYKQTINTNKQHIEYQSINIFK